MPALDSKPAFLVDPGTGELSQIVGLRAVKGYRSSVAINRDRAEP
jgi:hypothetical protein